MSEFRDLTLALRTFDKRITGIEECLLVLTRDSQQQAEWRHVQKNRAMTSDYMQAEQERAMQQVQEACGAISHRLAEVVERLENQAITRREDVKRLNARIGALEPDSEVTKP